MVIDNICCEDMCAHIYMVDQKIVLDDGDVSDKVIHYLSKFNEYGIPLNDEVSFILVAHCPWCGKKLPNSLREQWFSELDQLGFDVPWVMDGIPNEYKSWDWWKMKKEKTANR